MSGPTVQLRLDVKHGEWWLSWGNETFYDAERYLLSWDHPQDAVEWLAENHPELELVPGVISADSADDPELLERLRAHWAEKRQQRPGGDPSAQPGPAGAPRLAAERPAGSRQLSLWRDE